MKTEFLKNLGIEDQSVIDAIMKENGKDVNSAKNNAEQLQTKVDELMQQIHARDTQLADLKKYVKDNQTLTDKIAQLEKDNKDAKTEYENKIADMQKNYKIESAVRDAKAKNTKAVIALLDRDKITMKDGELIGLSEQLKSLTEGEDTSFLFGEAKQNPAGATPADNDRGSGGNNPSSDRSLGTGISLGDAVAKALGKK